MSPPHPLLPYFTPFPGGLYAFPPNINESSSSGSDSIVTPVLWGVGPVLAGHRGGREPKRLWFSPPSFSCRNPARRTVLEAWLTLLYICSAGNLTWSFMCHFVSFHNFLKSFLFQQSDSGHTYTGVTRCVHSFLIVTMHHRLLLKKMKDEQA